MKAKKTRKQKIRSFLYWFFWAMALSIGNAALPGVARPIWIIAVLITAFTIHIVRQERKIKKEKSIK